MIGPLDPRTPDGDPDFTAGAPYTVGWRSSGGQLVENDWRAFLVGLVRESYGKTEEYSQYNAAVVAALEKSTDHGGIAAAFDADEDAAVRYAVLLAYGLGRTAGGIEALDQRWVDRAKVLVGLDGVAARRDD